MTDRPDADDKGAPRRDGRRGRPDRPERPDRPDRARPASEAEPDPGAVTPRALRPSGPSRKLGRALPRVGDNTASVTEESPDRSAVDPFRFGDARLVPQREDAAADGADDEFDDEFDDQLADEEPVGGWAADAGVEVAPTDDAPTDDAPTDDVPTDDVPTDDSLGFGGARLVSSRRDDPAPLAPSPGATTPAGSDAGYVPSYTTIDSTPRAGSASTAAALTALSALLARFDDGAAPGDTAAPEPGSGEPDEPSTSADEPSTDDTTTPADEPATASIEIIEPDTDEPATSIVIEPDTDEPATSIVIEPDTDEPATTLATDPDTDDTTSAADDDERDLLAAVSDPTHDDGDEDRPASDTIGEIDRQLAELAEQLDTVPADPAPSTLFDHIAPDADEASVGRATDGPDTVATDLAAHPHAGTDTTDDTTAVDTTDTIATTATTAVDDAETADADTGTFDDTRTDIAQPLPDTDVADDAVAADDIAEPVTDADTVDDAETADTDTRTVDDTGTDTDNAEPVTDADTVDAAAADATDAREGDGAEPSESTGSAHDGIGDDIDPTVDGDAADALDAAPTSPAALVSDSLSPSQRVALDRELRNRLGNAVNDPEQVAAVAATLPPTIPARATAAPKPTKPRKPSPTVKKLTRWDRPAPPRDWRYFVGMLGRTLIVTGLLMFGFVAYQLWGTGIATARAQSQLSNQFEELVAENTGSLPPDATAPPATTSPADDPTPATTAAPGATTAPAPTPTIAPGGVVQDLPEIEPGKALARLEIARMGLTGSDALIVLPGVDPETLQDGPGHYPDTPLPGQLGNAAIAGHRTTWGEPFARIDELVAGDEIIVTMVTGDRFVYEVASTEIVNPEDYYVVTTTDPSVAELTLTSCHPRFSARQRIAVHAFLKAEESDPVGLPTFYDIEANRTPISGDDPTVTVPDSLADGSVDGSVESGDASVAPDATTPTTVPAVVPGAPGSGPDALTAGWFHDSAAWPHIGAWAVVCALIAIGAYFLSKRFRNYAVGWSIMVLPFVVCLYFLYENVNRLLPPGL